MKGPLPLRKWRLKAWQTTLVFGLALFVITGPSVFFFDYLAGSATLGFGAAPSSGFHGIGMFYLYMVSYFASLIVILPALLTGRFGTATAVFLPYVIIGFPINYYFEWVIDHTWVAPWSGVGWTAAFLLTGLSVDLALRYLPHRLSPAWRPALTGAIMGVVSFAATVAALDLVYVGPLLTSPGSFVGIAYFGVPWMIISSAFGGYTAYALARDVA
jgi:hypothetical protein